MGVVSVKELPRTYEREVGQPAVVTRRWVCVLSDNTLADPATTEQIFSETTGTTFGARHPDTNAWKLRKVRFNEGYEGSPYHVEVIGEYGIVRDEEVVTPVNRAAQWNFQAASGEFPALFYYDGLSKYPLTNSAYDYFPGLVTQESIVKATVRKNFANFPTSWYSTNNHVNNATYLGCPQHSIRVDGIETSYVYEEFDGAMIKYWAATATLNYRQSGHSLQLPDIGFNFFSDGQKRRAMVFDFENGEWVASPNPVGLDGSGGQTLGAPAILVRRVNPEANFQTVFGDPPP